MFAQATWLKVPFRYSRMCDCIYLIYNAYDDKIEFTLDGDDILDNPIYRNVTLAHIESEIANPRRNDVSGTWRAVMEHAKKELEKEEMAW